LEIESIGDDDDKFLEVKEIKQNFKKMATEEMVNYDIVTAKSIGKVVRIATYIKTLKNGLDDMHKKVTHANRMISKRKL